MIILDLGMGKNIENNPENHTTDFGKLLDVCFDISDYFTLTVHDFIAFSPNVREITQNDFSDALDEQSNKFLQEMQPYLLKKIQAFAWGNFGIMTPPKDVYIFKCENQAKAVIQKFFDDIYMHKNITIPDDETVYKYLSTIQDLCFFKQNDMILATVSHEYMCDVYPPDEESKNKFLDICDWNIYDKNFNVLKYPVEDIVFGASYRTEPLYLFLQSMRRPTDYYIREKSLERLYYYVKGYCDREINTANQRMHHMLNLIDSYFGDFVCLYYGDEIEEITTDSTYLPTHWSETIIQYSASQEDAFYMFYELLDNFLDENWAEFKKEYSFLGD